MTIFKKLGLAILGAGFAAMTSTAGAATNQQFVTIGTGGGHRCLLPNRWSDLPSGQ